MKKTIKITSIALAVALTGLLASCTLANQKEKSEETSTPPTSTVEFSTQKVEEKANQLSQTILSDYGATSVQYAVMDQGKIVLSGGQGFQNTETEEKVEKETMYGIASVSKMYASASVMILADQGKVDIDQPVTNYIKDFTMEDERYKDITVRMLLNHSSGLYGSHYGNSMLFDDVDSRTQDSLLANLKNSKLKSTPGEYSVYCNDGFQLLEILVERVSGKDYSTFVAENISDKLNLTHTKTPAQQFDKENLSKTYFPGIEGATGVETTNLFGTGGLYSTAEDVATFGNLFMGNKPEILSKASASAMANPEYRDGIWVSDTENTCGYGLGFDTVDLAPFTNYGIKALNKGGDSSMYHSSLTVIPEHNLSIAVLSAGGSSLFNTIMASKILEEILLEKGIIPEILPEKTFEAPVKTDLPEEFDKYNGVYASVGTSYPIHIENNQLILPELLGGIVPESTYVHVGDGKFKNPEGNIEVSFDEQKNGNTYIKVNLVIDFPGVGQFINVYYDSQKLNPNPIDKNSQTTWANRDGKSYYLLTEKPTSAFYLNEEVLRKDMTVDLENGYAMGDAIVDANHAVNTVEIPVMNGRDAFDLTFYKNADKEYLNTGDGIFINEESIAPFSLAEGSAYTIEKDGYAQWFTLDETTAGKTITITSAQNSGFALFDENGMALHIPNGEPENTVTLPEKGMIVFVGEPGSVFCPFT